MRKGMIAEAQGAEEDGVDHAPGAAHHLKRAPLTVDGLDPAGIDGAEVTLDVLEEEGCFIAGRVSHGAALGVARAQERCVAGRWTEYDGTGATKLLE